jgi:branched-chain amino acid transport system permease protein
VELFFISTLNGLSYGLLLFMLSAGLTLIFSLMGVLNFAHASLYMLGAYVGFTASRALGFWLALLVAPLVIGMLGALFERLCLRRVHRFGHVTELLITFGLSYVLLEVVQLVWGRNPLEFLPPEVLRGPAFTLVNHPVQGLGFLWGAAPAELCRATAPAVAATCSPFPATRAFMMLVALGMLLALWLLVTRSRVGLVLRAALTHPQALEALGHDVPRLFTLVFGAGAALAGLAGVVGGSTFITEPAMAATLGSVIFVVVVVGGMGSLAGAWWASLSIGLLQTFAVTVDGSLLSLLQAWGLPLAQGLRENAFLRLSLAQIAPVLPYLLLVLMLVARPQGLMGRRER